MKRKNEIGRVQLGILIIFLIIFSTAVTQAATYYVRTDGNDSNNGLTNNEGGAWLTIDYAADHVSAGDIVLVQPGTYEERVSPGVSGSSIGNTVTFYGGGNATVCGWDFDGDDYIRIIGFIIDTDAGSCSKNNGCVTMSGSSNDYLEFWNNTFKDANFDGIRCSSASHAFNNSIVIGNTFYNFGIGNGSGVAVRMSGDNNLLEYNEIYNVEPDYFFTMGDGLIVRNNYCHTPDPNHTGGHVDVIQGGAGPWGLTNLTVEANLYIDDSTGYEHHHLTNISNATSNATPMSELLFRRNVWHDIGCASISTNQCYYSTCDHVRIYNETFANAMNYSGSSTTGYGLIIGGGWDYPFFNNNLFYNHWGNSASNLSVYYADQNISADYNLGEDSRGSQTFAAPFTSEEHEVQNGNSSFVNYSGDDFHIQNDSDCIGNAGPLTQVNEPSDTTGTSFDVDDAGFFRGDNTNINQYSGNLVIGDQITVGTDTVRISSISGNTITVTESFTWANNENVYYGDDTTPDVGALPYRSGGYTLSGTYTLNSGTVTMTPNDADLVRMIVVFEDGIPVGADSISPFSVSGVGGGSLDVRIYPLYASKTQYVSGINVAPSPPKNLKIQ